MKLNILQLVKLGIHMNVPTSNVFFKPFFIGERGGFAMIHLDYTVISLRKTLFLMKKLISKDKRILLPVSKSKNYEVNMLSRHLSNKSFFLMKNRQKTWIPGSLSNRACLKNSLFMKKICESICTNSVIQYRKQKTYLDIRNTRSMLYPSSLFLIGLGYNLLSLKEAKKLKIPVIGVVHSKELVNIPEYRIPANYNSSISLSFFYKVLQRI